jgi:menaquinone-specific isochorismate synthase
LALPPSTAQGKASVVEFFLSKPMGIEDACRRLLSALQTTDAPQKHCSWQCELSSFDEISFLTAVSGVVRLSFKSRDRDVELCGLGTADMVSSFLAVEKSAVNVPGHLYFGAARFDGEGPKAAEWQDFFSERYVLPMLLVKKSNNTIMLHCNWRQDGHLSWPIWLDHATTLIKAILTAAPKREQPIHYERVDYIPSPHDYRHNIEQALAALSHDSEHQKVVLGRRNTIAFKSPIDPAVLYCRLKKQSNNAFLFFFDAGSGSAFFGASPELLYRRIGLWIETESLAGTRERLVNGADDTKLGQELLASAKDNREHSLVSLHIESTLTYFGITDIHASKLAIMPLPYVQHLVKRYRGRMTQVVNDANVIKALHPTPAVCGLELTWAREFIRAHEGFDRGLYAGPVGFFGHDEAEFAVGIRSALYYQQQLFVYAASGIVAGSIFEAEWAELDNKEKSMMSIFDKEHCP